MFEINQNQFFIIGMISTALIALANMGGFFFNLKYQNIFTITGTWAGIMFYIAMSAFFHYLYRQSNPKITIEQSGEDISELYNQIKGDNEFNNLKNDARIHKPAIKKKK